MNVSRNIFFNLGEAEIEKRDRRLYPLPFSWHGFAEPGEDKGGKLYFENA